MELPITTQEFTEILSAISEAKIFNEDMEKSCKSVKNPSALTLEILEKSQNRIKKLENLTETLKDRYLEYFVSVI